MAETIVYGHGPITDADVETAYNNQVAVVSQAAAEAGISAEVFRFTPQRIAQAIAALAAGSGDMILASAQTNTGIKTFEDTTMKLRNVADTFDGYFVNTNTADRIYTLPDAAGIVTLGTIGTEIQAWAAVLDATTASFLTADESKLDALTITGALTGDVVTSTNAATIQAGVVTYAKMQLVAADERLLGNVAGTGQPPAELDQATVLTFLGVEAGATADQTGAQIKTAYEAEANAYTDTKNTKLNTITILAALTGDVTTSVNAATIAAGVVSLAKMANIKEYSLIGKDTAGTGVPLNLDETDIPTEAAPVSGDWILGWDAAGLLVKYDVGNLPTAAGDMVLASVQTVTGAKTFDDTKFFLRNVADTFSGSFVNTNTADRIYTLPDAAGTIALGIIGTDIQAWAAVLDATTASFLTADESKLDGITITGTLTGDVTTSTNAATIAAGVVTLAKMANIKEYSLIGKDTAGTGVPLNLDESDIPTEASPASGDWALGWDAAGLMKKYDLVAFLAGAGDMVLADAQAVTGAKTYDPSTLKIAGATSGAIFLNATAIAGTGIISFPAATGTVELEGHTHVAADVIVAADERLIGNVAGASQPAVELTQAQVITFLGIETASTADQTGAEIKTAYEAEANAYTDTLNTKLGNITILSSLTGDVTTSVNAATIAAGVVTLAKMANVKEYSLIGKDTAGTGVPLNLDETDIPTEATPASGDWALGWDAAGLMVKYDLVAFLAGAGDMVLADVQTVTGAKTFDDTKFFLRNVADSFNASFVNTNTADRIYTLPDAAGVVQLGVIGSEIQAWDAVLDATTASFLTADESKLDALTITGALTGDVVTSTNAATIQAGVVTYAKMQLVAADERLLGNVAGAGQPPAELTQAQVLTFLGGSEAASTADQTGAEIKTAYEAEVSAFTDTLFSKLDGMTITGALTGDVTTSTNAATIADDAVTYAKMQNVAADERLLGNVAGAGAIVAELDQAAVLTFLGGVEAGADVTPLGFSGQTVVTDAAYTALSTDAGKIIYMNRGTAQTIDIDDSTFAADDVITIIQIGAGAVTIQGSATLSIHADDTLVTDGAGSQVSVTIQTSGASTVAWVTGRLVAA